MKIWTFLFSNEGDVYASVRVAAKTKDDAAVLVTELPGLSMLPVGYVCDFTGKYEGPPGVLRVTTRAMPTGDALAQLVALWLQPHAPDTYSRMGKYP